MNETDRIYVPFTTRMKPLEQLFHDQLNYEINSYLLITKKWLQTNEGLEYINTGNKTLLKQHAKTLENQEIDTLKLFNLLENQYRIGKSYANKSIGKSVKKLTTDTQTLKQLYKGVNSILGKFKNILIEDIKECLKKSAETKDTITEAIGKIERILTQHHTTPIAPITRSEMIARTEMNRSFNTGVLQTYANYGLDSFDIVNDNDIGVCETCIYLIANNPYTLQELLEIFPIHPNCRCITVIHGKIDTQTLEEIKNPIIINLF